MKFSLREKEIVALGFNESLLTFLFVLNVHFLSAVYSICLEHCYGQHSGQSYIHSFKRPIIVIFIINSSDLPIAMIRCKAPGQALQIQR